MPITRDQYFQDAGEREKNELEKIAKNIWHLIKERQSEIDKYKDDMHQSNFVTWTDLLVALRSAELTIENWRQWHSDNDGQTEDSINYGRAAASRAMLKWELNGERVKGQELSGR